MILLTILILIIVVVAVGAALFAALYAAGFFNYLGGKKSSPDAVSKEMLFSKLLALNDTSKPYHIRKGEDTDLVAEWKIVDATWYGIFSKNRLSEAYRARLLLDEARHSVRCNEEIGSVSWTAGTSGLMPSIHYQKSFFRGRVLFKKEYAVGYGIKEPSTLEAGKVYDYKFDVNDIRGPIIAAVKESGWEWVPVTAKKHATYKVPPAGALPAAPKASFCRYCGTKVAENTPLCPQCGKKIG